LPRQTKRAKPAREFVLDELGRAGDAGALAHYADPAYYSETYAARREDVAYYVRLARLSGGPVLEYGVGNGRVALAVARAGVHVVGVDLSEPMLASLKSALAREPDAVRRRVRAVHGDMRRVRLRRRFPLVIAPFNVVLHLYARQDVEQFLARVRAHLAPRGRFVFDFSLPQPEELCRDPARSYGAPRIRHPTTSELVRYAERFEYDPLRQVLLVRMDFKPEDGGTPWSVPLTHRQFFPREVEALLHYAGFGDMVWTRDFSERPADEHADSIVVSCRARGSGRGARQR
jgi:SAM-dependent methyltransferase